LDDAGSTSVTFGNGAYGARPPTAPANIGATYRTGIGKPGNVQADQITLLATKPLGVRAVTNPVRSSGGADPESRDQARRNVPLAVMALDRLVSTQDYADFSRTFAGIGKASAVRLSDGNLRLVHVTIAGADDIPIDTTSDLYRNLVTALHRYGDPAVPIRVEMREQLALVISANVKVLPDLDWEIVEPAVRARLLAAFGFDQRGLGQDVLASQVLATIQHVRGVDYVDLDFLGTVSEADVVTRLTGADLPTPANSSARPQSRIAVQPAQVANGVIRRAQLAYLLPAVQDSLILKEVTS
jgi:predicted phage baseplate assembly protein